MNTYKFAVSLCGGWCGGFLEFEADNEDTAYEKATDYVVQKLVEAFPELDIEYDVECDNPDDMDCDIDETDDNYFEAVEVCPHCDSENVYPMWNTEVSGFVAVCKHCDKEILLCDECQHAIEEDGEVHDCNWCKTECGGKCHRGCTKD